ncbi:hypothetical protein P167DRAFT_583705 [Morchella conica CCBAS932]|uniref:Uncharacterized protein n=1 Tax=Morchella conica CCBAS932 TaxID=1392247 RepID=A0A3N4KBC9_9PEZI|nr:hypothetical protein P167DRAFT_583705 [Morchella conica CCBAS932]
MASIVPIGTSPWHNLELKEVQNNFPTNMPERNVQQLSLLREKLRLTIFWARNIAQKRVSERLTSGELLAGDVRGKDIHFSKVMSAVFEKRATWLIPSVQTNMSKSFNIPRDISALERLLTHLGVPHTLGLRAFAQSTIQKINSSNFRSSKTVSYRDSVVFLNFGPYTKSFEARLQTLELSLKVTYSVYGGMIRDMVEFIRRAARRWHILLQFVDRILSLILVWVDVIYAEPEIATVQYEFLNDTFMEMKDTVREMVQGMGIGLSVND